MSVTRRLLLAGAAIAVALSFVFAALGDDRPEPEPALRRELTVWRPLRWLLRLLGLVAWLWVVAQTVAGGTSDAARSTVPALGYAGTYTFANVFLTFAGTLMMTL